MRHVYGAVLGVVMLAVLFLAAGWGVAEIGLLRLASLPGSPQCAPANCSASVEPASAVVADCGVMAEVTRSK
jgi:hypothetical protein